MLGVASDYQGPDKWEASLSWRYQRSDKHFIGHEYQAERTTEQSEVINTIHLADLTITRKYAKGWRASVSIPYLMAERSMPIRDASREVVDRTVLTARGIGDIIVSGAKWIWDPAKNPKGNIRVGLGVKLPTGDNAVEDTRKRLVNGEEVLTVVTVDQSVQPGDGGFGVVFDLQMFRMFLEGKLGLYATGTYLANPEGTSGVQTYRSRPGEDVMSIADLYLARAGLAYFPGQGFGLTLGYRAEGVPVYDLFGGSDGFRRPGYAISIEPGVSWTHKAHTVSLLWAKAVDRARLVSVPDKANGTHGDAAFADWLLVANYTRRF